VVNGASFRTGRTDGSDSRCSSYSASPPCLSTSRFTFTGVTCQRWSSGSWTNSSPQ
jgi:hypothetical protein